MKKLIFSTIEKFIKGVDTYNNNGSVWLIFTDEKRWVIELTKEGTLWYNYYFFQDIFKYFSLDVVENQRYITEWVENFIQNGIKHTDACQIGTSTSIEDAIQNGVKDIKMGSYLWGKTVEDTIQNGVKETHSYTMKQSISIEDTIQNGVKHTQEAHICADSLVEDVVQNGVKETVPQFLAERVPIEDTIQNGVKETKHNLWDGGLAMEEAIQNGVKVIKEISDFSLSSEIFKVRCKQTIRDGVKRTELGGKDRKIDEIKDIVENGVKETKMEEHHRLREVVQNIKNGVKNTINHPARPQEVVDKIINNGIKETHEDVYDHNGRVEGVIKNGIKETTPGGYLGSVEMKGKTVYQFEHSKQDNDVENVIESGIKATESIASHRTWMSEQVINNGIKETVCGVLQTYNPMNFEPVTKEMKRMNEVNIVLDEGIKEVKELPDKSGSLMGYGEYYARQENKTYPHTDIVNDVIRNGIKETKTPNDQNFADTLDFLDYNGSTSVPNIIDQVIENGINQTNWRKVDDHPTFVDRIIEKST